MYNKVLGKYSFICSTEVYRMRTVSARYYARPQQLRATNKNPCSDDTPILVGKSRFQMTSLCSSILNLHFKYGSLLILLQISQNSLP